MCGLEAVYGLGASGNTQHPSGLDDWLVLTEARVAPMSRQPVIQDLRMSAGVNRTPLGPTKANPTLTIQPHRVASFDFLRHGFRYWLTVECGVLEVLPGAYML
jgi:hypothetical protein